MDPGKTQLGPSDATVAEVTGDAPAPETPAGAEAFFLIVTGAQDPRHLGQVVPLTRERCVIGRGAGVDLRLEDTGLSREHALVLREARGGHAVVDLGSTNGTYLNGARVERAALAEGDRIQMGTAASLRYSTRARLQLREEQVRRALAASGVGTWEWQPRLGRLFLSDDSEQILGLGKRAGVDAMTSVHEEDRQRVREAFERALETGACDVECRAVTPSGAVRWLSLHGELFRGDDGSPSRLAGALLDVTDQREATAALQRQALIFESISDGLVVLDPDGFILDWNPGAERILGFTRADAAGHVLEDLGGLRWPATAMRELLCTVASRGRWDVELTVGRKDGQDCTIETAAMPLQDAQGRILAAVLVFRDVGSRRRMAADLLRADRLAGLWKLGAGLAHQINSPLAALTSGLTWTRNALGQLGVEGPAAQEIGGVLAEMAESLQQIASVVRDLRTLTFGVRGDQPQPVDVNRVVELALGIAEGELRPRAKARTRLARLPQVLASEALLVQAIQNVVVEAAHRCHPEQLSRNEIEVSTAFEGTTIQVCVADNGSPLSPADLAHLFDPYHQIAVERPGASLAMPVALGLVQAAGGTIEATSTRGRNLVQIRLPAAG